MQYLKTYLQKIKSRGNEQLAESVSRTAEDVGNAYLKTFFNVNRRTFKIIKEGAKCN